MNGLQLLLSTLGPLWKAMLYRTPRRGRFTRFYTAAQWATVRNRRRTAKLARRKNRKGT